MCYLDVKSGKDIGISPVLFKMIKNNIDKRNEFLIEARKNYPEVQACSNMKLQPASEWNYEYLEILYERMSKECE